MIGVFDSGSGGLSVLLSIVELSPSVDVVYFGDIKNVPYGNKSSTEVRILTQNCIQKLADLGVNEIVSACNSMSVQLDSELLTTLCITEKNIIEMVGPTVAAFQNRSETHSRILLVGTAATVTSGIYQSAFRAIGLEIQMCSLPELAGAIEEGKSNDEIESIIRSGITEIEDSFDVLVLACTHYPLAMEIFRKVVPKVEVFDSGKAVALEVQQRFEQKGTGILRFIISKDSTFFRQKVQELFGSRSYTIEVHE